MNTLIEIENMPVRQAMTPSRIVMSFTVYKSTIAPMGNMQAIKTVMVLVNLTIALWEYVTM